MKEYKILEKYELEELQNLVCKYLKDGWIPLGGVAVTLLSNPNPESSEDLWFYTQAIGMPQ